MKSRRALVTLLIAAGVLGPLLGWAGPAAAGPGDPESGRAVFEGKRCGRCHAPRGAGGAGPPLEELRRPQGEMELAGRLWNHVPGMFASLTGEGAEWPQLTAADMADLMAYLQADPARDPAPDLSKGQLMVLRKGCLKCHKLRREGGPVKPDLADQRSDYESAATWAATMWTHTPRMAAMASRQGVPYPRFTGDEMVNLVGFLRNAVRR